MHALIRRLAALGTIVIITSAGAPAQRLAPLALAQDGRVTLSPSFTPDGQTMYFAQSECSPIWECPQTLKVSHLGPDGWSAPQDVPLPAPGRVDWPFVSPDGRTLVFAWSAERPEFRELDIYENFDLYTLDLTDPAAVPQPIACGDINRPRAGAVKKLRYVHNESLPSMTLDGDLYFMTERLDGIGERDIYRAKSDGAGCFRTAVPLPAPINSPGRDDGVWVNPEGDLMLLTYGDRGGEGGADLFVSRRTSAGWSEPRNLGPTINSPYSEFGARLTPDGASIVFSSDRPFQGAPAGGEARLIQVWIADFDPALAGS